MTLYVYWTRSHCHFSWDEPLPKYQAEPQLMGYTSPATAILMSILVKDIEMLQCILVEEVGLKLLVTFSSAYHRRDFTWNTAIISSLQLLFYCYMAVFQESSYGRSHGRSHFSLWSSHVVWHQLLRLHRAYSGEFMHMPLRFSNIKSQCHKTWKIKFMSHPTLSYIEPEDNSSRALIVDIL